MCFSWLVCAWKMQDRASLDRELFQWTQTSAMISAVTVFLNFFLVVYSLNVNDGVVFFISVCCVVIQSIVVCSPGAHYSYPSEVEYVVSQANFASPYGAMLPQRSYIGARPHVLQFATPGSNDRV
jgi:hypothetical protein